ncbi:MAG: heme exporter protein CcmB [Actinomycetota bacterium]
MTSPWTRQMRALLLKDLRLELRTRDTLVAMLLFAVLAMLVLQFAFQRVESDLTRFAAGVLWVVMALTSILGVGRSYVAEREQGVLDGLLVAPVSRLVMITAKALAIVAYLAAVEVAVVPMVGVFFVKGPYFSEIGWLILVCLLADVAIGVLGSLLAALALHGRARELLLPVIFLPSLIPVVIAASGATHAITGGPNDLAEYRGYCLFLLVYAVTFGLVTYATYESVFDD